MPTCPNGHQSAADDWCEVCGYRMPGGDGASGASAPPFAPGADQPYGGYGYPGGAVPQGEVCPQCRTPREAQAPFCEQCRYHFLTHSPTAYGHPGGPGQQHSDFPDSPPSTQNRPAEPIPAQPPRSEDDWSLAPPAGPYGEQPYPAQGYAPPQADLHGYPGRAPHQERPDHSGSQAYADPHGRPGPQGRPARQPYPDQLPYQVPPPYQEQSSPPEQQYASPDPYGQQYAPVGSAPDRQGGWSATVGPDREYFTAMMQRSGPEGASLNLPEYSPEQQLPLAGAQVTIGRRRNSTGEAPDIDLSRSPEDPGVSHQHALLVQQPDGGWAVVDQDSTNGTTVNGAEEPIQPYVPVPLQDGDQVHVGAWTTITVRRD